MARLRGGDRARLLVRDLTQLATPAAGPLPRRGAGLSAVEVSRTRSSSARATASRRSGACATSRRSTVSSRRSTGAASARCPASSTATPIRPGAAIEWRSSRSAPPGRATRSCTPPAAGSSRPSRRRGPSGRTASVPGSSATPPGSSHTERQPGKASRATASTGTRSSNRSAPFVPRAVRQRGSGRTLCRRSTTMPTPISTSRWRRSCPRPRGLRLRRTCSSSEGRSTPRQARRYLEACRDAGLALRLHGDQFTESGADPAGGRTRRAFGRSPRGDG